MIKKESHNNYDNVKEYHEETKHSQLSVQMSAHYLDWDNRPHPFKIYNNLPIIKLPSDFPVPDLDSLEGIGGRTGRWKEDEFDIRALAQLLFFSAGITRKLKVSSGTYYMRAASATGALYPIELYVVCEGIRGLEAGVYHFGPGDFALTLLHTGDFRHEILSASQNNAVSSAPATIVFTSLAWRNAWKYQARSYRHWFWDSGVIAANLLAVTNALGLDTEFVLGFVDSKINRLLLLEDGREAAIVLAPVGIGLSNNAPKPTAFKYYTPEVQKLSKHEIDYPSIWTAHKSTNLASEQEVKSWRDSKQEFEKNVKNQGKIIGVRQIAETHDLQSDGIGDVILRRGSSRRFSRMPIPFESLCVILQKSTAGIPFDFLRDNATIIDVYLVASAVDGLEPGGYFFDREKRNLEYLVKCSESGSRNEAGFLCLGQSLFSDASAVFFLMTDLEKVLDAFGGRGYRAAQFEAGVIAGKIYLSSYAQNIGASGSTFYDDSVTEFFSPHAEGRSAMIAVGIGKASYKPRPGTVLAGKINREEIL